MSIASAETDNAAPASARAASGMPRRSASIGERALRALQRVLALLFIAAVGLNFANVIGRYVFGQSIPGADELQIYALVCMAFLGTVLVSARQAHLRMDLFVLRLPAAWQRARRLAEGLLVTLLTGFVGFHSARYAMQMHALDARSDDLRLPTWLPHSVLALGFGLMALIALFGLAGRHASTLPDPDIDAAIPARKEQP